jgi:Zn-dependent peptidase ImmA (M78 family)
MATTIQTLREVVPTRPLTFTESLRIAELQASKLLALAALSEPPFTENIIAGLPRIQIERMTPAPVSGATQWSSGRWLILLNGSETRGRQRFSLAHEFKHVLDNPFIDWLYPAAGDMSAGERAEQVCDHFAACLLIPRLWLKRAWASGEQSTSSLAKHFDVSRAAMSVRLRQIGLVEPAARCEGSIRIAA